MNHERLGKGTILLLFLVIVKSNNNYHLILNQLFHVLHCVTLHSIVFDSIN